MIFATFDKKNGERKWLGAIPRTSVVSADGVIYFSHTPQFSVICLASDRYTIGTKRSTKRVVVHSLSFM